MFCVETESSSLLRTQKTLVHNARARLHATSLIDAVGRSGEREREREKKKEDDDAFFFFLRKKKKTTKKKKKDPRFGIEE